MKVDCALQDITLTSVACATTDSCGTAFPLAQKQAWKWLSFPTNGHEVASQHKKCCGQEEIGSNHPGREVNMPPVNPLFFSKKLTTKHHAVCAGVINAVPIEMKGVITAVLDTITYSSPLMLDLEYCSIKEADRWAQAGSTWCPRCGWSYPQSKRQKQSPPPDSIECPPPSPRVPATHARSVLRRQV